MLMTREQFEDKFRAICEQKGIKLFLKDPDVKSDNGYAYWNEVHLGTKYRNNHIFMAIAFHEFSHAVINLKRAKGVKKYKINSCFMEEWLAWSLAMRYYAKYIGKPFTQTMGKFVVSCLKSHSQSNYAFKDIFGDKIV